MKKIVFYINAIHHGGAERVMVNLAKQFVENGDNVVLVTSFKDEWEYDLDSRVKRFSLEEKEICQNKIKRNISRIFKLRKILKREKPDLLISFMCEPNFRAILANIGLKSKIIVSVRNDPEREYSGVMGHFVAKFILPFADGYVFQTEDAKKYFSKSIQNKSAVIFNAVDPKFFDVKYSGFSSNNIVTLGRLCKQKNHELLIDSFCLLNKDFPELNLLIYGDGNSEKLQTIIDNRKMNSKIRIMGATKNVEKVLSECRMFVLSSDYEGLPNALLEAISVGVPSVSTNCPCGGPKMIIENNKTGILVDINNKNQLYEGMKKIISDSNFAKEISIAAKNSSKKYNPNAVFNEWNQFFDKIRNDL